MTDDRSRKSGRLFVISGPSGSGKTSIVQRLKELPGLFYSISATSRAPRAGETQGVDYLFHSREEFEKMVEAGAFAEYAEVAGNLYGTPADPLKKALERGQDALVDIDVNGAMQIKEAFPEATLIFIEPPDMQVLEKRLRDRATESEGTIARRLELARREMEFLPRYDCSVVNDELERAIDEVKDIILGT